MNLADWLLSKPASERNTYLFNAAGSIMAGTMTLVIQTLATRVLGPQWAGRISADVATVVLLYYLCQFNMRPYQCTDVNRKFSFGEYLTLKAGLTGLMFLICLGYVFLRHPEAERVMFCLFFCIYKAMESFSDCFWGMFQQKGRLDLAGLGMASYEILGIAAFAGVLLVTKRPGIAAFLMACLGFVHLFFYTIPIAKKLDTPELVNRWQKLLELIFILAPLFAAGYFMNISITLPKYALDLTQGEVALGYFSAVFLPAQGVFLTSGFFYNPRLRTLGVLASEKNGKEFKHLLVRLILVIFALTLLMMAAAYLFLTPVLSALFSLDLSPYRMDIVLVMAGGGFFGMAMFLIYAMIAMRRESGLFRLSLTALVLAGILDYFLAKALGIHGAVLGYVFSMLIASALFSWKTVREVRQLP